MNVDTDVIVMENVRDNYREIYGKKVGAIIKPCWKKLSMETLGNFNSSLLEAIILSFWCNRIAQIRWQIEVDVKACREWFKDRSYLQCRPLSSNWKKPGEELCDVQCISPGVNELKKSCPLYHDRIKNQMDLLAYQRGVSTVKNNIF